MNKRFLHQNKIKKQQGIGLVEALIAAVIAAVGLLALSYLQTSMTRASANARVASLATQVATETIEDARSFTSLGEYSNIVDFQVQRQLLNSPSFTVKQEVSRYRFNSDPDGDRTTFDGVFEVVADDATFEEKQPEFKQVAVTVSWQDNTSRTREIALTTSISSATPQDGLSLAKEYNGVRRTPQVRIRENTEVGVIPIAVGEESGNTVASASSNPRPKQYAEGSTGTTKFVVDTYLRDQANPLLQRKLDFAYASCVCKKGSASTSTAPAYAPTYWDGLRYTTPKQVVGKPTGVMDSSVDQDTQLCGTCCRDSHDKTTSDIKTDPFRSTSDYTSGDHNHYKQSSSLGSLTLAGDADSYLEACRMVRVDGVYQVATDTRLENFTLLRMSGTSDDSVSLPTATAESYATFAKDYVTQAFEAKTSPYPVGGLPNALGTTASPSALAQGQELSSGDTYTPKLLDADRNNKVSIAQDQVHYLNSRGIYIDWLSPKALERINCIGKSTVECLPYKTMELLQMVPFVAVNLTQLSMWGSEDTGTASVRSDPVPLVNENGNAPEFIRGKVTMLGTGDVGIASRISRSNSGLVNTRAIDPEDLSEVSEGFEEYTTNQPHSDDAVPFIVSITNSTSDSNFSASSVSVVMAQPAGLSQPNCAVGSTQQTSHQRTCALDVTTEPLQLVFGNYNYYTCTPLGNKWVFDATTTQCVLPPKNKNEAATYASPTIRNFQLCSVSVQGGSTGMSVSSVSTTQEGQALETASVTIIRNGTTPLITTLDSLTNPTFVAVFKTSCN